MVLTGPIDLFGNLVGRGGSTTASSLGGTKDISWLTRVEAIGLLKVLFKSPCQSKEVVLSSFTPVGRGNTPHWMQQMQRQQVFVATLLNYL